MDSLFSSQLNEHIEVMQLVYGLDSQVKNAGKAFNKALQMGGKILLMGNGGSAADAQHIAAELVGRYLRERPGLPAMALTTDTSILTAVANDYGYNAVFSRQVEALARADDVVVGYSTSGNSDNVFEAMRLAKNKGCTTVALTGQSGGKLKGLVDICLCVPSMSTPRIQEAHAFIGHMLCAMVDRDCNP